MADNKQIFTLPQSAWFYGGHEYKLDILYNIENVKTKVTDLAILRGCYARKNVAYDYWILDEKIKDAVSVVNGNGIKEYYTIKDSDVGIRLALLTFPKDNYISYGDNGNAIVEYGYYPQDAVDEYLQKKLTKLYRNDELQKTDEFYTFDYEYIEGKFVPAIKTPVYFYNGSKYIKLEMRPPYFKAELSNGCPYNNDDDIWIKISPVRWLLYCTSNILISEKILLSGIQFNSNLVNDYMNFEELDMYKYINCILKEEMFREQDNYKLSIIKEDNSKEFEAVSNRMKKIKKRLRTIKER